MSHDDAASSSSTFEQFLKAMGPKMKRVLASHHIPIEDAEDVLQQTLLALVHQWDSIRDPESWLLGTLRRNCCMYWRSYRRRLYSAVDSTLLELLSRPMAPPQERSDLLYDLRHMIGRLPRRCRSLLELRFQLGYEPAEVARRLGYRDSSIGKVTNRCLAALAREMVGSADGQRVSASLPAIEAVPETVTVVTVGPVARGAYDLGAADTPAHEACAARPAHAVAALPAPASPLRHLDSSSGRPG
ncbi:MAG TPA: sigma-70 family RNA polymerase sigma factor [Thermoanaerobaculia bacterium]|nr:sigma-70 family RNA polymerase sigma factor [Thermoanaerobaculia bacterium]